MNRIASIVLFLIAAALTAWLAVSSAQWMPPDRIAWMHLAAGVSVVVGLPLGACGAALWLDAPRGRARLLVTVCCLVLCAAGVGMLVAATVHGISRRPPNVWVTWLMLGVPTASIFGLLLPYIGQRYQVGEMRRLEAHDISST
jgi:hypothetical protein